MSKKYLVEVLIIVLLSAVAFVVGYAVVLFLASLGIDPFTVRYAY